MIKVEIQREMLMTAWETQTFMVPTENGTIEEALQKLRETDEPEKYATDAPETLIDTRQYVSKGEKLYFNCTEIYKDAEGEELWNDDDGEK